jgi:jumonji domain-containing protein 7
VTSMHQDWYENLYAVVRGTKRFTLVAPWEAPRLPKVRARAASFVYTQQQQQQQDEAGSAWTLSACLDFPAPKASVLDGNADAADGDPPPGWVDWIAVDLEDTPEAQWPPCTAAVRRVAVDVGPGDVLYLPAMWYHRVGQAPADGDRDGCVAAVNYWFDMNFENPLAALQAMLRKAAFPPSS